MLMARYGSCLSSSEHGILVCRMATIAVFHVFTHPDKYDPTELQVKRAHQMRMRTGLHT